MATFVLVHGAWHGGWCWDRVAPQLRTAGHEVHAPTLTGLSERAHLLSPMVGLDTHVEDVVRVIDVLGRIYLDAFVGEDGENAVSLQPGSVAHRWSESAAGPGFGWLVPVRKLEVLGATEQADIDWLTPRLTPHPWKPYTDPLRLNGAVERVPAAFIECVDWMRVFRSQADRARAKGWPVVELATGHEAMVTASKELATVPDALVG